MQRDERGDDSGDSSSSGDTTSSYDGSGYNENNAGERSSSTGLHSTRAFSNASSFYTSSNSGSYIGSSVNPHSRSSSEADEHAKGSYVPDRSAKGNERRKKAKGTEMANVGIMDLQRVRTSGGSKLSSTQLLRKKSQKKKIKKGTRAAGRASRERQGQGGADAIRNRGRDPLQVEQEANVRTIMYVSPKALNTLTQRSHGGGGSSSLRLGGETAGLAVPGRKWARKVGTLPLRAPRVAAPVRSEGNVRRSSKNKKMTLRPKRRLLTAAGAQDHLMLLCSLTPQLQPQSQQQQQPLTFSDLKPAADVPGVVAGADTTVCGAATRYGVEDMDEESVNSNTIVIAREVDLRATPRRTSFPFVPQSSDYRTASVAVTAATAQTGAALVARTNAMKGKGLKGKPTKIRKDGTQRLREHYMRLQGSIPVKPHATTTTLVERPSSVLPSQTSSLPHAQQQPGVRNNTPRLSAATSDLFSATPQESFASRPLATPLQGQPNKDTRNGSAASTTMSKTLRRISINHLRSGPAKRKVVTPTRLQSVDISTELQRRAALAAEEAAAAAAAAPVDDSVNNNATPEDEFGAHGEGRQPWMTSDSAEGAVQGIVRMREHLIFHKAVLERALQAIHSQRHYTGESSVAQQLKLQTEPHTQEAADKLIPTRNAATTTAAAAAAAASPLLSLSSLAVGSLFKFSLDHCNTFPSNNSATTHATTQQQHHHNQQQQKEEDQPPLQLQLQRNAPWMGTRVASAMENVKTTSAMQDEFAAHEGRRARLLGSGMIQSSLRPTTVHVDAEMNLPTARDSDPVVSAAAAVAPSLGWQLPFLSQVDAVANADGGTQQSSATPLGMKQPPQSQLQQYQPATPLDIATPLNSFAARHGAGDSPPPRSNALLLQHQLQWQRQWQRQQVDDVDMLRRRDGEAVAVADVQFSGSFMRGTTDVMSSDSSLAHGLSKSPKNVYHVYRNPSLWNPTRLPNPNMPQRLLHLLAGDSPVQTRKGVVDVNQMSLTRSLAMMGIGADERTFPESATPRLHLTSRLPQSSLFQSSTLASTNTYQLLRGHRLCYNVRRGTRVVMGQVDPRYVARYQTSTSIKTMRSNNNNNTDGAQPVFSSNPNNSADGQKTISTHSMDDWDGEAAVRDGHSHAHHHCSAAGLDHAYGYHPQQHQEKLLLARNEPIPCMVRVLTVTAGQLQHLHRMTVFEQQRVREQRRHCAAMMTVDSASATCTRRTDQQTPALPPRRSSILFPSSKDAKGMSKVPADSISALHHGSTFTTTAAGNFTCSASVGAFQERSATPCDGSTMFAAFCTQTPKQTAITARGGDGDGAGGRIDSPSVNVDRSATMFSSAHAAAHLLTLGTSAVAHRYPTCASSVGQSIGSFTSSSHAGAVAQDTSTADDFVLVTRGSGDGVSEGMEDSGIARDSGSKRSTELLLSDGRGSGSNSKSKINIKGGNCKLPRLSDSARSSSGTSCRDVGGEGTAVVTTTSTNIGVACTDSHARSSLVGRMHGKGDCLSEGSAEKESVVSELYRTHCTALEGMVEDDEEAAAAAAAVENGELLMEADMDLSTLLSDDFLGALKQRLVDLFMSPPPLLPVPSLPSRLQHQHQQRQQLQPLRSVPLSGRQDSSAATDDSHNDLPSLVIESGSARTSNRIDVPATMTAATKQHSSSGRGSGGASGADRRMLSRSWSKKQKLLLSSAVTASCNSPRGTPIVPTTATPAPRGGVRKGGVKEAFTPLRSEALAAAGLASVPPHTPMVSPQKRLSRAGKKPLSSPSKSSKHSSTTSRKASLSSNSGVHLGGARDSLTFPVHSSSFDDGTSAPLCEVDAARASDMFITLPYVGIEVHALNPNQWQRVTSDGDAAAPATTTTTATSAVADTAVTHAGSGGDASTGTKWVSTAMIPPLPAPVQSTVGAEESTAVCDLDSPVLMIAMAEPVVMQGNVATLLQEWVATCNPTPVQREHVIRNIIKSVLKRLRALHANTGKGHGSVKASNVFSLAHAAAAAREHFRQELEPPLTSGTSVVNEFTVVDCTTAELSAIPPKPSLGGMKPDDLTMLSRNGHQSGRSSTSSSSSLSGSMAQETEGEERGEDTMEKRGRHRRRGGDNASEVNGDDEEDHREDSSTIDSAGRWDAEVMQHCRRGSWKISDKLLPDDSSIPSLNPLPSPSPITAYAPNSFSANILSNYSQVVSPHTVSRPIFIAKRVAAAKAQAKAAAAARRRPLILTAQMTSSQAQQLIMEATYCGSRSSNGNKSGVRNPIAATENDLERVVDTGSHGGGGSYPASIIRDYHVSLPATVLCHTGGEEEEEEARFDSYDGGDITAAGGAAAAAAQLGQGGGRGLSMRKRIVRKYFNNANGSSAVATDEASAGTCSGVTAASGQGGRGGTIPVDPLDWSENVILIDNAYDRVEMALALAVSDTYCHCRRGKDQCFALDGSHSTLADKPVATATTPSSPSASTSQVDAAAGTTELGTPQRTCRRGLVHTPSFSLNTVARMQYAEQLGRRRGLELFTLEQSGQAPPPECIVPEMAKPLSQAVDTFYSVGKLERPSDPLTLRLVPNTVRPRTVMSMETDIYMVGMFAIELADGPLPDFIQHQQVPTPSLSAVPWSDNFFVFVNKCVHPVASQRPTVDELLSNDWFSATLVGGPGPEARVFAMKGGEDGSGGMIDTNTLRADAALAGTTSGGASGVGTRATAAATTGEHVVASRRTRTGSSSGGGKNALRVGSKVAGGAVSTRSRTNSKTSSRSGGLNGTKRGVSTSRTSGGGAGAKTKQQLQQQQQQQSHSQQQQQQRVFSLPYVDLLIDFNQRATAWAATRKMQQRTQTPSGSLEEPLQQRSQQQQQPSQCFRSSMALASSIPSCAAAQGVADSQSIVTAHGERGPSMQPRQPQPHHQFPTDALKTPEVYCIVTSPSDTSASTTSTERSSNSGSTSSSSSDEEDGDSNASWASDNAVGGVVEEEEVVVVVNDILCGLPSEDAITPSRTLAHLDIAAAAAPIASTVTTESSDAILSSTDTKKKREVMTAAAQMQGHQQHLLLDGAPAVTAPPSLTCAPNAGASAGAASGRHIPLCGYTGSNVVAGGEDENAAAAEVRAAARVDVSLPRVLQDAMEKKKKEKHKRWLRKVARRRRESKKGRSGGNGAAAAATVKADTGSNMLGMFANAVAHCETFMKKAIRTLPHTPHRSGSLAPNLSRSSLSSSSMTGAHKNKGGDGEELTSVSYTTKSYHSQRQRRHYGRKFYRRSATSITAAYVGSTEDEDEGGEGDEDGSSSSNSRLQVALSVLMQAFWDLHRLSPLAADMWCMRVLWRMTKDPRTRELAQSLCAHVHGTGSAARGGGGGDGGGWTDINSAMEGGPAASSGGVEQWLSLLGEGAGGRGAATANDGSGNPKDTSGAGTAVSPTGGGGAGATATAVIDTSPSVFQTYEVSKWLMATSNALQASY